ncbi:LacI family DNA-binding transcriptional regulator [Spirochaeta dissipatitropha]
MKKTATQKDVAELAGVSFITVSRVINKMGNVKPETQKLVEEAIKATGYVPSFAGKALNSGLCQTIGVMTPVRFSEGLENNYLLGILQGIERFCRLHSYDILLSPINNETATNDLLRPYMQRKIDGMIYIGLQTIPDAIIKEIEEKNIPCVVIGDRPDHKQLSWIDTDNYHAAYQATRNILNQGHVRVAFFGLDKSIHNANISDRESGYVRAIEEAYAVNDFKPMIIRGTFDYDSNRKIIREFIENSSVLPTAIFCATDSDCIAIFLELLSLGITVPDEISLVGFDGFFKSSFFNLPHLTTNEQPLQEMGQLASRVLIEQLQSKDTTKQQHILPVKWIEGTTLGPPKKQED